MADDSEPGEKPPAIAELLRFAASARARDLVLTSGAPPMLRPPAADAFEALALPPLTPTSLRQHVYAVLTDAQKHHLEDTGALAISFGIRDLGRFRLRIHAQRASLAATFRLLPSTPPTDSPLRDPDALRGSLTVIAGPSGAGKSHVAAAVIDMINAQRAWRIVTVEDPIEIIHPHKRSVVAQIDVPADTSWPLALDATRGADVVHFQTLTSDSLTTALDRADGGAAVLATLDASSPAAASRALSSMVSTDRLRALCKMLVYVPSVGSAPEVTVIP